MHMCLCWVSYLINQAFMAHIVKIWSTTPENMQFDADADIYLDI